MVLLKTSFFQFIKAVSSKTPVFKCRHAFSSTFPPKKLSFSQSHVGLIGFGIGAGALVGAGLSWEKFRQTRHPILYEASTKEYTLLPEIPNVDISRKVINPSDVSGLHLVLFQYPTCPFCCKVRAFLDYYGISYDVVEVDPVLRQQMSWSEYKKVPILLAKVDNGYQQLNDSSMIISALKSYLRDTNLNMTEVVENYPLLEYRDEDGNLKTEIMNRYFIMLNEEKINEPKNEALIEERKWRKWADDKLVHTLSPNVYRTWDEAKQAFTWFSEVGEWDRLFPAWERYLIVYLGAFAMWMIGKRLKKRYNLKEDVRQSLYDECKVWSNAVKTKGTPFLGGNKPNLADLAVYGVLSSIEGCTAFEDLKGNTSIGIWFNAMKDQVQSHKGLLDIRR